MNHGGDYLSSNIIQINGKQQQQQHLRKPSPQMLQFFKQDKSIQEDMDDETVAIIDNQQFASPFNHHRKGSRENQIYNSNDILDPSQSQEPDDLYMEMMAGEINAEDLVRSTQKNPSDYLHFKNIQNNQSIPLLLNQEDGTVDIGEQQPIQQFGGRNLYQHTSELGRATPTLLTQKQDFNKLHSVYDLKRTLDQLRKQSRSGANNQNFLDQFDEQNDKDDNYLSAGLQKLQSSSLKIGDAGFASNYPKQLQVLTQHRQQTSNYEEFFGPGGLQSPRTIPDIDLHNLLLNSGSFSGADKLKTVKAKARQEHHHHYHHQQQLDKQFESSLKSIEVLQHLQSDPHILLQDAAAVAGGRSRSGDIGTDEDEEDYDDYDTLNNNNKLKQNSRSDRIKEISSASITPEQSKQQNLNKDIIAATVPKSALPSPQIEKLPNATDTSDLDDNIHNNHEAEDVDNQINIQNNQRHAAQIAIQLHSFNSLDELLSDQSGLKQKALDLISEQIFQAIVNRDLIMAPYLFPDRQEESMIRASLRQQQNIEDQNASAPPPALLKIAGVNTSLGAIASYLDSVIGEIVQDQDFCRELGKKLKEPIEKDPYEVLEQLQNSQIGSYQHFLKPLYCDGMDGEKQEQVKKEVGKILPPVPKRLFQTVSKKIQLSQEQQEEEEEKKINDQAQSKLESEQLKTKKEQIQKLVNESKKMHSKMLFDSLNEALENERPYGTNGVPMPWILRKKLLQCQRSAIVLKNQDQQEVKGDNKIVQRRTMRNISARQKLERAKQKVLMNSSFRAGVFPSMLFVHEGVFDEEEFSTERERRLAALLANEVIQSENNWLEYGFEQAQVKIDLGDMILERLVTQSIYIMDGIESNRIHQNLPNNEQVNISAAGKSIFSDGGFLQQQQELFQLTMSRSMNQNMIAGSQNINNNVNNNNSSNLNNSNNNYNNQNNYNNNNNSSNQNNQDSHNMRQKCENSEGISSDDLEIIQNIRISSINQNCRDQSPNPNQNTEQNTGGTCTVIDNIDTESPMLGNQQSENAFNGELDYVEKI